MDKANEMQEVKAVPVTKKEGARPDIENTRGETFVSPDVDIYETDNELVLIADVPGVAQEGVELELEDGVLQITARRASGFPAEPIYAEFRPVSYYRAFSLPEEVDASRIDAGLREGVLTVTLPKSPKAKPRKIEVKSA